MYTDYDVIIIGSGSAGLAAGIYTSRAGFSTLIMEKKTMGGELMNIQLIENYPGFANGVMGPDLASAMLEQASNAGAEVEIGEVTAIKSKSGIKTVRTDDQTLTCKGVILATGSHTKKLKVPGEEKLANRGVFYCATCDGAQSAGKPVVVAGAGDSALTDALYLAKLGCKVTILGRSLPRASKVLLDRAEANPNIEIKCGIKIESIVGDDWVTGVDYEDTATGTKSRLEVAGIYIRIGMVPNTQFLEDSLELGPGGLIPVNENMETAIPGIYAAGDVRVNSPAQIATSVGDGVTAAMAIGQYINSL
ncbi:NAD(P)/FAD-dependent oxidoreductase [Paenibacillus thalictri]|uniref:FAD-binding protein n=1 Tax=Paenibacillus thalictri TaxID=2527873 RepID=A0A4V2J3Y4_9BACL|nr:FAD-dependent oxidoreductase [Paenibacillus thalictri]TBL76310.1 FAD-binding protein [Paenibacillus thalictri]